MTDTDATKRRLVYLVAAITSLGLVIRLAVIGQSLFADELSTYWIIANHVGFGGVYDIVHTDAEITPPLYFLLAKAATQIELSPEMLRLPSLIAGVATIPLTYLVGARAIGARVGVVAAAVVALSPFMIFYSTEARAYGLMMFLLLVSTVALLRALDGKGRGWWVVYAACSCAAMYTHYTVAFALAAQALWALWAHPGARRAVLLANLAAALAFLPWLTGLMADLDSPTTKLLSALEPFDLHSVARSLGHWGVGNPHAVIPLDVLPGRVGLGLLLLAAVLAIAALCWARFESTARVRLGPGLVLLLALGLSTPVVEALVSLVTTNLFGTRNLAVAWPGSALLLATLVTFPRRRIAVACTALVLVGFGIAAAGMLKDEHRRPEYDAAAELIEERAPKGDVVIEGPVLSPGPLTSLDAALGNRYRILRVGVPQERDHPFNVFDREAPALEIADAALANSTGGRLIVVTTPRTRPGDYGPMVNKILRRLPDGFRVVEQEDFKGIIPLRVLFLKESAARGGKE